MSYPKPLHWWVDNVLPLVYDNALSYYEVVSKVTSYINGLTGDMTTVKDQIAEIQAILDNSDIGDIPALMERMDTLEAELNSQSQRITGMGSAMSASFTTLNTRITTEKNERTAADTTLDDRITQEVNNRTDADNTLDGKITQETTNRTQEDSALNVKIDNIGHAGDFSGAFTSASQQLNTGIALKSGVTYYIDILNSIPQRMTMFASGDTTKYVRVNNYFTTAIFTPAVNGNLILYNLDGSLFSVILSVDILGSTADRANKAPKEYFVSKSAEFGSFHSVTEALIALKDDNTPKIIYIEGGDYDIYQEYHDAGIPVYSGNDPSSDFWDYCVWVPDNTHIIGRGTVRLMWMPTIAQGVTTGEANTVSPLNVAGSCIIENMEVHCKNGRYCLHDDPLGRAKYSDAIKEFRNVKFFKYANEASGYGFNHTTGYGFQMKNTYKYSGCEFYNEAGGFAYYGHSRQIIQGINISSALSSNITFDNCLFITGGNYAIKLGNSGTTTNAKIRTDLRNCYLNKPIEAINESGSSPVNQNAFAITMVGCSEVAVTIADTNNRYPAQIYTI